MAKAIAKLVDERLASEFVRSLECRANDRKEEKPTSVKYNPLGIRGFIFLKNMIVIFFHPTMKKSSNSSAAYKRKKEGQSGNISANCKCEIIHTDSIYSSMDMRLFGDIIDNTFLWFIDPQGVKGKNAKCGTLEFVFIDVAFSSYSLDRLKAHLTPDNFKRLHYFDFVTVKCIDSNDAFTQMVNQSGFKKAYLDMDAYIEDYFSVFLPRIPILKRNFNPHWYENTSARGNGVWENEISVSIELLSNWFDFLRDKFRDTKKESDKERIRLYEQVKDLRICIKYANQVSVSSCFDGQFLSFCDTCSSLGALENLKRSYISGIMNKVTSYCIQVYKEPQLWKGLILLLRKYNINIKDLASIKALNDYDKCKVFVALFGIPYISVLNKKLDFSEFFFNSDYDNFFKRVFDSEKEANNG